MLTIKNIKYMTWVLNNKFIYNYDKVNCGECYRVELQYQEVNHV
jgi:hypothetical protein